jgi:tubulin-specific chaperone A
MAPPPSNFAISLKAVSRLVTEEAYYHKEIAKHDERIQKLEDNIKSGATDEDGNDTYLLNQEVSSLAVCQTHLFF